jgi:hypothetical protein
MENPFPRRAAANPTQYNIDAIAKLEHEALDRRTPTERVRHPPQSGWLDEWGRLKGGHPLV